MRHISFALTTEQVRRGEKTVTRRTGWETLAPGTLLLAVEKGQGLKRGEKVKPIRVIRVKAVRRERLDALTAGYHYGRQEMIKEGFPGRDPQDFVESFADGEEYAMLITRIEFEYVP